MLDYYSFRRMQLNDSLNELEQADEQLNRAKNIREKQKRKGAVKKAEGEMRQAANKVVQIEPHLAYLCLKARHSKLEESIRDAWLEILIACNVPSEFHILPDTSVVSYMPPLSFMINIPFRLQKPYLSKDEQDFHLLENPLRREKIFKTPMVAATSWKGALRATLWQLGHKQDDDPVTLRLLGNSRENEKQQAGRLYFFPTFFDKVGLEVINPHDRKTGTGTRGPILMECVPQGTKGDLILLYVPFGDIDETEEARLSYVADDLQALAKGIRAMLTTYGFGAKTSSGFGTAEGKLAGEGKLAIRAKLDGGTVPTEYRFNGLNELCEELAPHVAELLQTSKGDTA
jgi:CRISPR-associated protein Cmr2